MKLFIHYVSKHKLAYGLGLLVLLLVDYFNLYLPQITGEITDGVASFRLDLGGILNLCLQMVIISLGLSLGRFLWRYFIFGTSRKIERELRDDMFAKLETLSQSYFNSHKTGDLMTNFTNDLEAMRVGIGPAIISAFDAIVMTVMVLYKMIVYVDLKLTLLTLLPMSIIAIGGYYFGDEFERRFLKKQKAFAKLSDFVQESITGERVIKAFVQEKRQDDLFEEVNAYNKKQNMEVVKLNATILPLMDFIIGLCYVITIMYGGYLTIINQITLGRFVAFNAYISMLVWPMIAMGDCIISFSQAFAAQQRIKAIFDEVPDIKEPKDPVEMTTLKGKIDFNDVSFKYQDHLPYALNHIDVHVQPGETLALIGRTGSGKTTFIHLLSRLYDVSDGSILVDGVDIRNLPLKTLREQMAFVIQDNYLFSDTLENNIKFGLKDATHEKVVQACKDACVHDNVMGFTHGYQTEVGERGVSLSGGQKQRCSIARALIKDAPILILDDALSAVDTDTEERIVENLKRTRQGKTTIMIAHRISTIKHADHIMVLDDGKIVEYGSYDELMALNGEFKAICDQQQLEKEVRDDGTSR